jgi:superfamily II DNA or RNA helicase
MQPIYNTLDSQLNNWINALESAYENSSKSLTPLMKKPQTQKREIRYVLKQGSYSKKLTISAFIVKILKNGSASTGRAESFNPVTPRASNGWMEAMKGEDWELALLLMKTNSDTIYTRYADISLDFSHGFDVLKCMMQTNRCYLDSFVNEALRWGENIPCHFEWVIDENGNSQRLTPVTENPKHLVTRIGQRVIYVDPTANIIGELIFEESPRALDVLFNSPPVPFAVAEQVKESLVKKDLPAKLFPKQLEIKEIRIIPQPILKIASVYEADIDPEFEYRRDYDDDDDFDSLFDDFDDEEAEYLAAEIDFDYGGYICPFSSKSTESITTKRTQTELVKIHRDLEFEKQAVEFILQNNWQQEEENIFIRPDSEDMVDEAIILFLQQDRPLLEKAGWRIDINPSFPVHRVLDSEEIYIDVVESTDANNWFDAELGVLIGDERINLLPFLQTILKTTKNLDHYISELSQAPPDKKISLINNKKEVVLLTAEKLLHFLTLFNADSLSSNGQKFKLSSWNMVLLSEIGAAESAAKVRWFGHDGIRKIAEALSNPIQGSQLTFPSTLQCELRPYQVDGVAWMQTLRESEMNGVLADDMGLGKTVQTIAHLSIEKEQGRLTLPSLILAPTTLLPNWIHELKKFAPHFKVLVLHGNERKQHFSSIKDYDIIFTTYPLLSRDKEPLMNQEFYYLILDEAQYVKNSKTLAYQIVHQLKARHRLLLTGTPMENHLGEIWSLFHLVMPGLLGDEKSFNKMFRKPIEQAKDKKRQILLSKRLKPFMIRRTKNLVAKELPEKTVIIQRIELDVQQRNLYESIRLKAQEKVMKEIAQKGFNRSQIVVLDALLKMRQACCDPRLVNIDADLSKIPSAKLNYLKECLPQMIEEGKQIILFSQFTSMLALIEKELNTLEIGYTLLTGDTSDRETPVKKFQNKEIPLILLSLKAGGVGINLTAADTVIFFDPWWNPAAENQATDRAHRIGQNKTVFVYKLVTEGTVEEKILALQEKKKHLLQAVFDTEEGEISKLSLEDLQEIFQPL